MNKLIIAASIFAAFAGSVAHAEEAAAPAPDNVIAYNVGVTSDYRFRGLSQSRYMPAVFGGVDYTNNPTGLYAGAWASSIKWISDVGGHTDLETDFYAGKRGEISGITYDVGVIRYYYSGNKMPISFGPSANTTEAYAQLGYGVYSIKYSQALTNFVAWADSKGSNYIDLSANPEIANGYVLNLHVGKQVVDGPVVAGVADYTDWKIGVTKDFGFAVGSLAVVGTDADKTAYTFGPKYIGKTGAYASLTKSF
jgi:uncharacterized protein (TIGR02001 family)